MTMTKVEAEIDLGDIKDEIQEWYDPADIFDEDRLIKWAEDNGYKQEGE